MHTKYEGGLENKQNRKSNTGVLDQLNFVQLPKVAPRTLNVLILMEYNYSVATILKTTGSR